MAVTSMANSSIANSNKFNRASATRPRNNAVVASTTGSPTIATANGYTYYAFTGDGSITFEKSGLVGVLCIGAGGTGAFIPGLQRGGGGGGAGGVHSSDNFLVPASTLVVEVGAGGSGSSVLEGIAYGILGGRATNSNSGAGGNGGSGSGAGGVSGAQPGEAVLGQGNDGGAQANASDGGGGGGAGEAGNTDGAGVGGDGTAAFSSWGIATSTGQDVGGVHYFAGGGGGGILNGSGLVRAGGDGGGGRGAAGSTQGEAGLANTGGGGGGSRLGSGGIGGSGIVIVRVG